jgi:hypothetical protein
MRHKELRMKYIESEIGTERRYKTVQNAGKIWGAKGNQIRKK